MKNDHNTRLPHYYLKPDLDEKGIYPLRLTQRYKIANKGAPSILKPEYEDIKPLMAFRLLTRWYLVKFVRQGMDTTKMSELLGISKRTMRNWINEIFKGDDDD